VPRTKAQKLAKKVNRVREGKMAPRIDGALSAKDLVYEEHKRVAIARALDGISLDPRENRRASQLPPPPAPG
jgi:hypothetical protein